MENNFCEWLIRISRIDQSESTSKIRIEIEFKIKNSFHCQFAEVKQFSKFQSLASKIKMSLNLKLVSSNKRKNGTEEEVYKETKKFVSIFSNIPLFTYIKENSAKCLLINSKQNGDSNSSIGYFQCLPHEIFFKILKLLTVEELSIFSLANSKIRNFIIENFLINSSGFLYLIRASKFDYDSLNIQSQVPIQNLFSKIGNTIYF